MDESGKAWRLCYAFLEFFQGRPWSRKRWWNNLGSGKIRSNCEWMGSRLGFAWNFFVINTCESCSHNPKPSRFFKAWLGTPPVKSTDRGSTRWWVEARRDRVMDPTTRLNGLCPRCSGSTSPTLSIWIRPVTMGEAGTQTILTFDSVS